MTLDPFLTWKCAKQHPTQEVGSPIFIVELNPPPLKKGGEGDACGVHKPVVCLANTWFGEHLPKQGHGAMLVYFLRPLGHFKNSGMQKWIWNMIPCVVPPEFTLSCWARATRRLYPQRFRYSRWKIYIWYPPTPCGGVQVEDPPNSGFATTIPQGAPLSTEHSRNVFGEYGERLVEYG